MARGKRTFSTLCDSCHSTWAPSKTPHISTKCEVHAAVSCRVVQCPCYATVVLKCTTGDWASSHTSWHSELLLPIRAMVMRTPAR